MGRAKEVSAYCERYVTETHSEWSRGRVACATKRGGLGVAIQSVEAAVLAASLILVGASPPTSPSCRSWWHGRSISPPTGVVFAVGLFGLARGIA